ncbi:uncharacterized protein Dwil_GK16156 [Drosophila willistoni]|uniref:Uncharacterized protein n=1 Tax=Drosophila willistoni TaxID=7260 RepID=A0A0Q9WRQ3_DROWI|nr:uncharacterized protein LOC6644510 isoform X1 [Drosophila willistoni]XP_046867528.1 uncharacterized protein LOC6644510 isoform X1 [Drosophila willistoni]KRF98890.1 uncharacterized protein Dwil_GK16156 [Drosophila willistoni]
MSTPKVLGTRRLLGSMTTSAIHSICRNASSNKSSAVYRLVHAKRVSAATRNGVDEVEKPVPTPMSFGRAQCLPLKRSEQEQRRLRKAQVTENVKRLQTEKCQHPKIARLPFRRPESARPIPNRRYNSVKDLLKTMSQPHQLASELVNLSQELSATKEKNKRLLENYHDLLEKVTLKGK